MRTWAARPSLGLAIEFAIMREENHALSRRDHRHRGVHVDKVRQCDIEAGIPIGGLGPASVVSPPLALRLDRSN